ncbi:nSTAND1 domain-containing NTPase [Nonomuraea sp. KM88]|uniref:nSTAND1 domain-containing NTPase n=1 Tax=Nonomuraea sp. KM88 TaxID=3457427 RepID=UPI003FCE94E8
MRDRRDHRPGRRRTSRGEGGENRSEPVAERPRETEPEPRYGGNHVDFRGGTFHETVIGVLEQHHHHYHDQERAPGERFTGAPYRGLTPFGEDDGELFHGREQATAELAALLGERLDTHGMVVVTGPSGAGKTSLMRAGVLPHLGRHPLPGHPDSTRWPYAVMTPTSDPLTALATQLAALIGGADPWETRRRLAEHPERAPALFRQAVLARAAVSGRHDAHRHRLVLIVDQFEEIFTLPPGDTGPDTKAFLTALREAARSRPGGPPPAALVIIVVRGDHWDHCAAFPQLTDVLRAGPYLLGAMSDSELRQAIIGPAAFAGLRLDDGLTELVVGDLRTAGQTIEPGTLPLLSQSLLTTWHNRDDDRLTIRGYSAAGGVAGAVQASAEAAYHGLTDRQQALVQPIFHRLTLITPGGQAVRRPAGLVELRADGRQDVDEVLRAFVERRLLVAGPGSISIAHEALLRCWPRLAGWLAADQDHRILYDRLREDVDIWQRNGRDRSFLYTGTRLAAVTASRSRWERDPLRYPPLPEPGHAFVARSQRAAARRKALARIVMAVIVAVAAVAVVQGRTAETRRLETLSSLVMSESTRLRQSDPATAALLAATASRISPSDETRYGMRSAWTSGLRATLHGRGRPVTHLAISSAPSGAATVLSSTDQGVVHVQKLSARPPYRPASAPRQVARGSSAVLGAGGRVAAIFGADGWIRVWNADRGGILGPPLERVSGRRTVAFTRDGSLLALARSGTVSLWDTTTGRLQGEPLRGSGEQGAPSVLEGLAGRHEHEHQIGEVGPGGHRQHGHTRGEPVDPGAGQERCHTPGERYDHGSAVALFQSPGEEIREALRGPVSPIGSDLPLSHWPFHALR